MLVLASCQLPPAEQVVADASSLRDGGALDFSASAYVHILVTDEETGRPLPARAIIQAQPGTTSVSFDRDPLTGEYVEGAALSPGVVGSTEGVLLVSGEGMVPIPAGKYSILVTHGPEWEIASAFMDLSARSTREITLSLLHSVDNHGWLSADTHIHTGRSFDSTLPPEYRVISEVTVGVSVVVVTDHNVLTDVQPMIEMLGYGLIAKGIVGDEFNFLEGHGGAYPLPYDGQSMLGGAFKWNLDYLTMRNVSGAVMFDWLHTMTTHPLVTINHPRMQPDLGYFTNLRGFGPAGWSPPTRLPTAGKFDNIEIINGYMDNPSDILDVVRDWFFLLSSGYRIAATAGSDSHSLSGNKGGFPRTWIGFPSSSPSEITEQTFADAVRKGRTIVSSGPFAWLTVNGKEIGALVSTAGDTATIEASVDAPDWIDVDHVEVYLNGTKVREADVTAGQRPLWRDSWEQTLPPGDSWIVLLGRGSVPLIPDIVGIFALPMVVTSPIFIDGDGDGKWLPHIANPDPGPLYDWEGLRPK